MFILSVCGCFRIWVTKYDRRLTVALPFLSSIILLTWFMRVYCSASLSIQSIKIKRSIQNENVTTIAAVRTMEEYLVRSCATQTWRHYTKAYQSTTAIGLYHYWSYPPIEVHRLISRDLFQLNCSPKVPSLRWPHMIAHQNLSINSMSSNSWPMTGGLVSSNFLQPCSSYKIEINI